MLLCMSIEFITNVHQFDGLILLATCDLIISGAYILPRCGWISQRLWSPAAQCVEIIKTKTV